MSRLRKFIVPGEVYFITTSVESTLAFPPNELINTILLSCLARAQELYPVIVCEFLISTTHVHFIIVARNPEDVCGFMCRFKTETAHALNRLLGYQKRTIWCQGYDSPMLYKDLDRAVEKVAYIYANPAKDNLVKSIDDYPGLSSWSAQKNPCAVIPRSRIKQLTSNNPSLEELAKYRAKLIRKARTGSFTLNPSAWMEVFGVTTKEDKTSLRQRVIKRVRELEAEAEKLRIFEGKSVIGAKILISTPICAPYVPKRMGKRMYIICGCVELRKTFLTNLKAQIGRANEVFKRWKVGDFSLPFPLGLFPPSMPRLATPLSVEAALSAAW